MHIRVNFDWSDIRRLNDRGKRQIPFAMAKALTRTAQAGQRDERASIPQEFTMRNTFMQGGVRITPATKASLKASVHHINPKMALHATGGRREAHTQPLQGPDKTYQETSGMLAIPVHARPNIRDTIRGRKAAHRLVKGGRKHFVARLPESGQLAVMRRKTKKRFPLEVMYVFTKDVRIKRRWNFTDILEDTVKRRWDTEAKKALLEALRTAK